MSQEPTKAHGDHQSDPARTPGYGWVGEGGASHLGPATHTAQGLNDDDENNHADADGDVDGDVENNEQ